MNATHHRSASHPPRFRLPREAIMIALLLALLAAPLGALQGSAQNGPLPAAETTDRSIDDGRDRFMQTNATGTLRVNHYACPHWIDLTQPGAVDALWAQDNCFRYVEQMTFNLSDGGSYNRTQHGQEEGNRRQQATFTDVPGGTTLTVSVSIPDGYHPPLVFCKQPDTNYEQQTVIDGNRITWEVSPGTWSTCKFFNIIARDYIGTLEFGAYDCERALDLDASFGEFIDTCATAPMSGIEFRVTGVAGDPDRSISDTTNTEGTERFLGLIDSGIDRSIDLTEVVPAGYSDPVVWCDSQDGNWVRHDANSGSVTLHDSDANVDSLACMFFNYAAYPRLIVTPIVPDPGFPVPVLTPIPQIPLPTPTPEPPELVITPPLEDPVLVLTPTPGIPQPSPTPEPPQLVVTPPVDYPILILTPVIQFPTPTPAPEVPTFEVIPIVPKPIPIVTPIPDAPIGIVPDGPMAADPSKHAW